MKQCLSIKEAHTKTRKSIICTWMAAGRTDHVWTMEALLSYRVPPDFRSQLDQQATNITA